MIKRRVKYNCMDTFRINQPEEELHRKADKAQNKCKIWTVEEVDYFQVAATRLAKELFPDDNLFTECEEQP